MPCLNPIRIRNRRYVKMNGVELEAYIKDNGIPDNLCFSVASDSPVLPSIRVPPDYYIDVPCGKCFYCIKRRRSDWSFRLLQEIDLYSHNTFVTLSFSDDFLTADKREFARNGVKSAAGKEISKYIDRLRKYLGYRPKYFFVSEFGDEVEFTGRLHFHGIIFNTPVDKLPYEIIRKKWKYGNVWTGYVNHKTAFYVTKYLFDFSQTGHKPILQCSNGIGSCFVSDAHRDYVLNSFDPRYLINYRHKTFPLSSYYKNKFFSDDIKVVLMLNRYSDPTSPTYYLNHRYYYSFYEYKIACISLHNMYIRMNLYKSQKRKFNVKFESTEFCLSNSRNA